MPIKQLMYALFGCLSLGILFVQAWAQQFEMDPALQKKPAHKVQIHKPVLQGNVTTLQDALLQERNSVDWYGWYLACRDYLSQAGGLECPLGTMIRFNGNGSIQALTQSPACMMSVAYKRFPLPKNTKLSAILLPVRKSSLPPASAEELYYYLTKGK